MMKNNSLLRTIIVVAVSLIIITAGILVPFGLLSLKSNPDNLPHGEVDAENIQPYGADTIRIENSLIAASDRLSTMERYPSSEIDRTWIATKRNQYNEIGIQERLYDQGYSRSTEFINALDDIFYDQIDDSAFGDTILVSSTAEIDQDNEHTLYNISAHDNTTQVVLDGSTGIPVQARISIVTPNVLSRSLIRSRIIELYSDYTGLDFVYLNSDPGTVDEYDSFYLYQIENTDHKLSLTIVIESGWYWLPPNSNSEEWTPTDSYIWTVSIYCNNLY